MSYLASRIVLIMGQPLSLACLLVGLGLMLHLFRFRKTGHAATLAGFAVLFVTLFTNAGSVALAKLENLYPKPAADPADVACVVMLGGAVEGPVTTVRGGFEFNQAADRFTETLRLALAFPAARIVISGGDGSISGRYEGDAVVARRFLAAFGIDGTRILTDTRSRTTTENVDETKTILAENGLDNCLLVTSAFHMARSMTLFETAGIKVRPWPVDYRTDGRTDLAFDFTQPALNAQLSYTATREWGSTWRTRWTGR